MHIPKDKHPLIILLSTVLVLSLLSISFTKQFLPPFLKSIDVLSDFKKDKQKDFKSNSLKKQKDSFDENATISTYTNFKEKLNQIRNKKSKIKIAYLGDSFIENDFITHDLRKMFQQKYGGNGIGFIPMSLLNPELHSSVYIKQTNYWSKTMLKDNDQSLPIGFSGSVFISKNDNKIHIKKKNREAISVTNSKLYLICGAVNQAFSITIESEKDTNTVTIPISNSFYNKVLLTDNVEELITMSVPQNATLLYGIEMEEDSGVYIDNYAIRGSNGTHILKMNDSLLAQQIKVENYDLVIIHFGINVLNNHSSDFEWYKKGMTKTILKLKSIVPSKNILLISSSDKATQQNGIYQTDKGLESLLSLQQQLAQDHQIAFYNLFEAMGGENSIVDWVNQKPPLAYKDYTHLTQKGATLLAEKILIELTK